MIGGIDRKLAAVLGAVLLGGCGGGFHFADLWLTADQQGCWHFERGDYAAAAESFEDPMWKGTAAYLNEDFESALAEFSRVDTAAGWFNRSNALAHLEHYEEAVAALERALELQPDYPEAEANLDYLQPFLPLKFEGGEMGTVGRDAAADDFVFDADGGRLEEEGIETVMESEEGLLSDQQLAEVWLRQVDTSPSAFLRYKFAYQSAVGQGGDE